jgi:hypothetical protein
MERLPAEPISLPNFVFGMSPLAASGRRSGAAVSISVGWLHGTWLLTTVFVAHPQDRARDFNAWQRLSSWRYRRPSDQPARKRLVHVPKPADSLVNAGISGQTKYQVV